MRKKYDAADCGKANTKVFMYDTKTFDTDKAVIATNVAPVNSLVKASMGHSQYIVNINTDDDDIKGEWMIGAVGGESSYSNSKKDKIHKIMALVGIALVTHNGDTVVPAIGCPISIFEDEQQKAELYNYLIPDGRVDISINGTEHYFYFEEGSKVIEEALISHVGKIDMVLKDWDTSKIDMIFIGGTSKLLEKYILDRYRDRAFIPEDTDFINCKRFLKAMVSMAGYTCPF